MALCVTLCVTLCVAILSYNSEAYDCDTAAEKAKAQYRTNKKAEAFLSLNKERNINLIDYVFLDRTNEDAI